MEKKTIWRLQEADFLMVIEAQFPHLSEKQKQEILDRAKQSFAIHDWEDHVSLFIETVIE